MSRRRTLAGGDGCEACAEALGITRRFVPSHSPHLNLIERLWKFLKRRSLDGRDHPAFANLRAAIEETLDQLATTEATDWASLSDPQPPTP